MTDHTITLTSKEMELVVSALLAVSPSGGGSSQYTLARKICSMTGVPENYGLTQELFDEVLYEYQAWLHEHREYQKINPPLDP